MVEVDISLNLGRSRKNGDRFAYPPLVGALVGLSAGRLAASGCDILAALRLPDFPYKPESFFAFPAWLLAASLALAVLCCVVGAMVPARKATRLDPAEVLSSR